MYEQHDILGIGILKQKVIASDLIEIQLPLELPIQTYCMALIAWDTCEVNKISAQANVSFWGRFDGITFIQCKLSTAHSFLASHSSSDIMIFLEGNVC